MISILKSVVSKSYVTPSLIGVLTIINKVLYV